MRRGFIAAITAATFVVTPLLAAEIAKGPLAPGKPAGLRKAQLSDGEITLLWIGAGVAVAAAVIASDNGSDAVPITPSTGGGTTTTTST